MPGILNRTDFGRVTICDPGSDKPLLEVGTVRCCHCGGHWIPRKGSGAIRGWCERCMGPVCGPRCAECVPMEARLENLEAGRPEDHRRIIVPVSFGGE